MKTISPMGFHRKMLFIVFFALMFAILMAQGKAHAANTTYYVDPAGADTNNGTSINTPWKTLTKVNGTTFTSGDKILFKAGNSWTGQLTPKGSGVSGSPIIIDQYGTGNKPLINGNGAGATLYLMNQQYWEIQNLEIKNYNGVNSNRRGIEVVSKDSGTLNHIYIKNNNIHDVWGDNVKDTSGSAGILFVSRGTVASNFNDVLIDNNTVGPDVDRTGIGFASDFSCRSGIGCTSTPNWYASTNVVISNNYVQGIGGDGIVPQETQGAIVQYNTVNGFNMRSGSYNAGIWPWNADNTVIQYNEAYGGHTTLDGTGYDTDYGCTGTIIQYNYSHDNDGGFLLLMGTDVGTVDQTIVRYNISQNDKRGILVFASGNPTNTQIYNNDFYIATGTGTEIVTKAGNAGTHAWSFNNNIIYNLSSGGYDSGVGGMNSDYNIYFGNHPSGEPNEPHKLISNAMFVNAGSGTTGRTNVDGYKLLQGSPALGSGVVIANNGGKDYWGNAVSATTAPNRGAYNGAGVTGSLNMLSNPGFESGVLTPWTNWNTASVVSTNARSGSKAMQLSGGPGSAEQKVFLNPNTTYTLTGYAKTFSSSEPVTIGVKNYGGAEKSVSISSTSYTLGTLTFTTGSTNTSATIYLYKPSGGNWAWFDDFELHADGITIDGSVLGRTFDGEGVLSGGGGNTRLLIDYPEPYRSDILDYLFKPNFGAGYTHLKVEVGGDVNSTSGAEPSHARTLAENSAPNMNRGYELWLMSEAKKRNPDIKLSILEWGAPLWVGSMWSQNNADYLVSYIKGAKSVWGLDIDYVGGSQNESYNGTSQQARDYIVNILRPTLDNNGLSNVKIIAPDILSSDWAFADRIVSDTALKNAVSVIGYHYVNGTSTANAQNSGLPIWESEGWTGVGDWTGSYNLAKLMNENYIKAKLTATMAWHLINSNYDNLSWPSSGIMIANTPWSGNYKVQPSVWAAAHTNQFVKPGWKYIDSGSGMTAGNTSYVTMKQPDTSGNYSMIMVTGNVSETLKFNLTGGLSTGTIHVWKSNSTQQFIQQSDISPSGSTFSIDVEPNSIYSLTTTTGQKKGVAANAIPVDSSFPNPYSEDFESYAAGVTPKYTQDEHGAFETSNKYGSTGKALRQIITGPLLQWNSWGEPTSNSAFTEFGDLSWRNYDYSADVLIENEGTVSIIGRVGTQNRNVQQDNKLKGYKLVVDQSGKWKLVIGAPDVNSETQLASGTVPFTANTWHNLKLSFQDTNIKAYIDSVQVASITDNTFLYGMAGLGSGWNNAQYDNVTVTSEPLRPNLALGNTVSADSQETSNGNVASNANDGNTDNRWTANDGGLNHWLKVDLGSVTNLTGTEVVWEHNNVYKYKIELSNDNVNWNTISDKTGNTTSQQTQGDNFTASGRYVRITVTGLASGEWASVREFRVFGSGTAPVKVETINITGAGNASAITVKNGTLQLGAEVLPADAANKSVTWAVYEADGVTTTDKATIDTNGLLTAVKDGTVSVLATALDVSGTKGLSAITISGQSSSVTPVTSISVYGQDGANTITIKDGTLQMHAAVLPAGASSQVTWSLWDTDGVTASNKGTISANGMFTAAKDGIVKVVATATDGSGIQGSNYIVISGQLPLPTSVPQATLTGPASVQAGTTFSSNFGLNNVSASVSSAVYAADITLSYNANAIEFVSVDPLKSGFNVAQTKTDVPGQIRLIAVSEVDAGAGAITTSGDVFKFNWKAKPNHQSLTVNFVLTGVAVSNALGQKVDAQPTQLKVHVTVVEKTTLQTVMTIAQSVYGNAVEGNVVGQYPAGSKADLLAAINAANAIYVNPAATQEGLDGAAIVLNEAVQHFNQQIIRVYALGDANKNGYIDIGDLGKVALHYGKDTTSADWNEIKGADFNNNGKIDFFDLTSIAHLLLQ